MTEKIDETLRRIAAATPSGTSPGENSSPSTARSQDLPGDPDCPLCGGLGYIRLDVPLEHPDFGRLQICTCRQAQVSAQIRQRLFAMSNLEELRHLTFETFQPRGRVGTPPALADSLELAYNQSRQFSGSLNGWLVLQGTYGCGKTHLAAAIANFAVQMGVPTLFLTVPDLLDTLRFAYDDPESTFEERLNEIRQSPLLVMDDFGTQNATPWAQEKLFQIINYRYINRLPLVVTTNMLLGQIEPRIRSRLEDPELVTRVNILAGDYRRPTEDSPQSSLSDLGRHRELTFSRFEDRRGEGLSTEDIRSLERAVQEATDYARHPEGWLIFTGPHGCGKTHLAAAIGIAQEELGRRVIFKNVIDLLDHLRSTFSPASAISMDRLFEEIRTAPLLILDDLGSQSSTPWAREKLYQLLDYRYVSRLPTVITTANIRDEIDARLLSRFEDTRLCRIVGITAPNYRGGPAPRSSRATTRRRRTP
jgi:DNA replication protein DnaC